MGALGLVGALLLVFGPAAVLFRVVSGKPVFVLAAVARCPCASVLAARVRVLTRLCTAALLRTCCRCCSPRCRSEARRCAPPCACATRQLTRARAVASLSESAFVFPALLVALVVQEGATRPLLWHGSKRALAALNAVAREERVRPTTRFDMLLLALALGLGHGLAHAAFFALPLLALSGGEATLLMDRCPQVSLFSMTAACTCAMVFMHAAAMPVAFYGWSTKQQVYGAAPALLHTLATVASVSSLAAGGCVATVVLLWLLAAAQVLYAGHVALAVTARH